MHKLSSLFIVTGSRLVESSYHVLFTCNHYFEFRDIVLTSLDVNNHYCIVAKDVNKCEYEHKQHVPVQRTPGHLHRLYTLRLSDCSREQAAGLAMLLKQVTCSVSQWLLAANIFLKNTLSILKQMVGSITTVQPKQCITTI